MKVSASVDTPVTRLKSETDKARQRAIRSALDALAERQRSRSRDSAPQDAAKPSDAASETEPRS